MSHDGPGVTLSTITATGFPINALGFSPVYVNEDVHCFVTGLTCGSDWLESLPVIRIRAIRSLSLEA